MNKEKLLRELKEHSSEIVEKGITEKQILDQLEVFERGKLFTDIIKPCVKGDGIFVIDESQYDELLVNYRSAAILGRLTKFVPASGAATRMFKCLQSYLNISETISIAGLKKEMHTDSDAKSVYVLINNIKYFAFYEDLKSLLSIEKFDLDNISDDDDISIILRKVLDSSGLNYSFYPKGAILFHKYNGEKRTAFEEHIFEAAELLIDQSGVLRIHFTISEEHVELFNEIINKAIKHFHKQSVQVNVTYSFQKKSTDTISVTLDNQLFKDSNNKLVFRPAGHGALIENLNDLDADIVLIKNIDNILPSTQNAESVKSKKILTGFLIKLQKQVFNYIKILDSKNVNEIIINEIKSFVSDFLSVLLTDSFERKTTDEKADYLFDRLNRPLRVCGMVKNEGHPGGGPFWARNKNDEVSVQIVEESQINKRDRSKADIFEASTHFNPVDLICAVRDFNGKKFNLKNFVDESSGLITTKTFEGRQLKALELPGLWNGAMAYWNTVFVEIPAETFNPVKEINDLLKPQHRL
ncbi:MAG TPA: DUF4301 family protein [Ignavibacteriaceae bacterium]|nr:DUF4301 family protein [Ignavibacteriaceae bacterium]